MRIRVFDGNEAAARVAYAASEVIALYPITPASPMGELADRWSAEGRPNLWGSVPRVVEMQSEGGAAGAVHGALQGGALTTTFTASQGLLLMIPEMYKIAGELSPAVIHVAARSVAAQALSIFGDHSDVMAARTTGWAILSAGSVQEAHDFALVAHAAALRARIPFLHVFDGFRTSHEINTVVELSREQMEALLPAELVRAHRGRALSPDRPCVRGTAQNPDVFFQAREAANPFYAAVPEKVERLFSELAALTGRSYRLFDYQGHPEAEQVLVMMGSGAEAAREAVEALVAGGRRVGLVKVRLFRPFSVEHLLRVLPPTVRTVAVLDRTKEPGAAGEPLYQDVVVALAEGSDRPPRVIGGRYGLASKEFTPAMAAAVLEEAAREAPRNHFTVGIRDDVTHTSLDYDAGLVTEDSETVRAVLWGLGSDGTVSAAKSSVRILAEQAGLFAQGYFVYDSRKAGARTISHLRFGRRPVRSPYLVQTANLVGVHHFEFLRRYPVLDRIAEGGTFLLNSPYGPEQVWDHLPRPVQETILEKRLRFFVVDAHRLAREVGLDGRISTVMQTCFLALTGVLPRDEVLEQIRRSLRSTYGHQGEEAVERNAAAVRRALDHLREVEVEGLEADGPPLPPVVSPEAPEFVRQVIAPMLAERGDELPVSALPADGTWPPGTTRWEKRNLAREVPVWEPDLCIQCGKCVLVCPHACIRSALVPPEALAGAPEGFPHRPAMWREHRDWRYTLQVSVEDCTGCRLCVEICPAHDRLQRERKALRMAPQLPLREKGRKYWESFRRLPETPRGGPLRFTNVKNVQLLPALFEFSGACSGCGETPYLRLLTQLFGNRAILANATGCSSIYGGNLPTHPWTVDASGCGPAWNNSLFEDNAEFGLGIRLAVDQQLALARRLVERLRGRLGEELACGLLEDSPDPEVQRRRVGRLRELLAGAPEPEARDLAAVADVLVPRSVWIVGGDGWAYDIGYGGLDHVLASGARVNLLVLDTEVYSNTGGQASKATPLGAVARFAAAGKRTPKKDLAWAAIAYGSVYVAQVAMGANDTQTVRAFLEAESFPGTSLILAHSPCIAHGIDMAKGLEQQKRAVASGHWPLFRYDPRRNPPMKLDCRAPTLPLEEYLYAEGRFRRLREIDPAAAEACLEQARRQVQERWARYAALAGQQPEGQAPPSSPTRQ